jgi:adenine-specific DNA-methyltransferase
MLKINMKRTLDIVKYTCKNTEQLGILVERAMCDIMKIPFNTKRKYESLSTDIIDDIDNTIGPLLKRMKLDHVGNMNTTYDFIDKEKVNTMSVKTIMSGNKICPQNIGQCSLNSLNAKLNIGLKSRDDMKDYFIKNRKEMMDKYLKNCFCCDRMIVYKFDKGCIYVIDKKGEVKFNEDLKFTTSKELIDWNESNTIYVDGNKKLSLGEIQIHNNRDCVKFRFNIEALIELINNNMISNVCVNVYNLKTRYNFTVKRENMKSKMCFPSFNYIGSKLKLLEYITETICDYTGKKSYDEINGFADICSGTGVVAFNALRGGCKSVLTNDIQHYAYMISSIWSTKNVDVVKVKFLVNILNEWISGMKEENIDDNMKDDLFVYSNYTEGGAEKRMYLTRLNGYKTDMLRNRIDEMRESMDITDEEYRLLLKLLLYAVSNVSNIASVYGAYLKSYKKSALKDIYLNGELVDNLVVDKDNSIKHVSYNNGIIDLLKTVDLSEYEVVYMDPPYVANRSYHDNYHVLETISRNDKPEIKGKTGLRKVVDTKSRFCSKREAYDEFENVLSNIKSKYIFISYSSESIISKENMIEMMKKTGWKDVKCYEKMYARFKSNKNNDEKQPREIIEYIFCGNKKE